MKRHRLRAALPATWLLRTLFGQGWAEAIATGDVAPAGATDPWEIDGGLLVGSTGTGTLNIEAGGVVCNTKGDIGSRASGTGMAT